MTWLNDSETADALQTINGMYLQALDRMRQQDMIWQQIATPVQSNSEQTVHMSLGNVPGFHLWRGDRKVSQIAADSYTVVNRTWQSAIEFSREDIEDDLLGQLEPKVSTLASRAMMHRMDLLIAWLALGFSATNTFEGITVGSSYDGQAFF